MSARFGQNEMTQQVFWLEAQPVGEIHPHMHLWDPDLSAACRLAGVSIWDRELVYNKLKELGYGRRNH